MTTYLVKQTGYLGMSLRVFLEGIRISVGGLSKQIALILRVSTDLLSEPWMS